MLTFSRETHTNPSTHRNMELTLVESGKLSRKRQTQVLTTLEARESNPCEVSRGGNQGNRQRAKARTSQRSPEGTQDRRDKGFREISPTSTSICSQSEVTVKSTFQILGTHPHHYHTFQRSFSRDVHPKKGTHKTHGT